MASGLSRRIYATGKGRFANFLFLSSLFAKLLETIFHCLAKFTKLFWQTVGVAKTDCNGSP
jgi:hypothetical protein